MYVPIGIAIFLFMLTSLFAWCVGGCEKDTCIIKSICGKSNAYSLFTRYFIVVYFPLTLIAYTNVMNPYTESVIGITLLIWSIATVPIFTLLPLYFTYVISRNANERKAEISKASAINEEEELELDKDQIAHDKDQIE